jgi:hypothetical protein
MDNTVAAEKPFTELSRPPKLEVVAGLIELRIHLLMVTRILPFSQVTTQPGTELNRRRQPFQNVTFEYSQRFTSRRGSP